MDSKCGVFLLTSGHCDFLLDKEDGPKTINDIKLIHAGKILENNRTLADSRLPIVEFPGGVITMHVVLHHPRSDKGRGNTVVSMFFYLVVEIYHSPSFSFPRKTRK